MLIDVRVGKCAAQVTGLVLILRMKMLSAANDAKKKVKLEGNSTPNTAPAFARIPPSAMKRARMTGPDAGYPALQTDR